MGYIMVEFPLNSHILSYHYVSLESVYKYMHVTHLVWCSMYNLQKWLPSSTYDVG